MNEGRENALYFARAKRADPITAAHFVGSRHEPVAGYGFGMETRCHWRYTHPAWGWVVTKEPFSEADARRLLPDAERVDGSEVTAEQSGHLGWGFASGLVRRADGAMVQDGGLQIERHVT